MSSLFALLLIFGLGHLLARLRVFSSADSDFLQRLCFYVAFPALATLSFQKSQLSLQLLLYPLLGVIVFLGTFAFGLAAVGRYDLDRQSRGTFLLGSMLMNMAFVFPFVIATRGERGLATAMLFDFGNGVLIFSLGYYVACRHGREATAAGTALRKVLTAPPLWGLFFGTFLNLTGLALPETFQKTLELLGSLMVPSYMLALGIRFSPRILGSRPVIPVLAVRMGGGLVLGTLLSLLLGLEPATRAVVIASAAAPPGFSTLTFSSMTKLDVDFAASIVSCSLVLGIIFLPLILTFAG